MLFITVWLFSIPIFAEEFFSSEYSSFIPFLIFLEAANAVGPPLMIIGILFAGFYIKIGSLPIVADWVPYFSLFRWGFEVRQCLLSFVTT